MDTGTYLVLAFPFGIVAVLEVISWFDPEWPANCSPFEGGKARQWKRDREGEIPEPDPLAPVDGDEYLRIIHGRRFDPSGESELEIEGMSEAEVMGLEPMPEKVEKPQRQAKPQLDFDADTLRRATRIRRRLQQQAEQLRRMGIDVDFTK